MAKPALNLCGLKCLVKIIIAIVIVIAIVVAAFLIVGNMTLSQLKIDQVKLGTMTLQELGLSEMTVKSVGTAAFKLCTAKEEDFVTNPFDQEDKATADAMFDRLQVLDDGTPKYASLLLFKPRYTGDKLHVLTDESLGYIYQQVFASSGVMPAELEKLGLQVASTSITDDKKIVITFSIDVSSITKDLPSVPFLKWPTKSFLQYSANIAVSDEGVFDVTEPSFNINGVDADATKALVTALEKTLDIQLPEGKTLEGVVIDTIKTASTTVVANMGIVCRAGTSAAGDVDRTDVICSNNAGIGAGTISFIKYL